MFAEGYVNLHLKHMYENINRYQLRLAFWVIFPWNLFSFSFNNLILISHKHLTNDAWNTSRCDVYWLFDMLLCTVDENTKHQFTLNLIVLAYPNYTEFHAKTKYTCFLIRSYLLSDICNHNDGINQSVYIRRSCCNSRQKLYRLLSGMCNIWSCCCTEAWWHLCINSWYQQDFCSI